MIIKGTMVDGRMFSDYNMTDIHMHLIPGVDDGAWNMEMAEDMIRMSVMQGIRHIVATPHGYGFDDCGPDYVLEQFEELKQRAAVKYPEVTLHFGCEVPCQMYGMPQILKNLEKGQYPSICGTKYVLSEFSPYVTCEEMIRCCEQLLEAGWIPVLAHVERYKEIFRGENPIGLLKSKGCKVQINVYSVKEENNKEIRKNAKMLLDDKLVDFLGSDAHRTIHRPPMVEKGLAFLYEHYEKEYVDQIAYGNAKQFLFDGL